MLPAGESELAGQSTQPEFPVPDLYVPPEHCAHVPPLGPMKPALHWHAVSMMLPAAETELVGQDEQVVDPSPDLYSMPSKLRLARRQHGCHCLRVQHGVERC